MPIEDSKFGGLKGGKISNNYHNQVKWNGSWEKGGGGEEDSRDRREVLHLGSMAPASRRKGTGAQIKRHTQKDYLMTSLSGHLQLTWRGLGSGHGPCVLRALGNREVAEV